MLLVQVHELCGGTHFCDFFLGSCYYSTSSVQTPKEDQTVQVGDVHELIGLYIQSLLKATRSMFSTETKQNVELCHPYYYTLSAPTGL